MLNIRHILLFLLLSAPSWAENFHPDCADPHNKEISCSVHVVSCDDPHVPVVSSDTLVPPEAHDVRVDAFARAVARDKANHQLHVDISWQMPPNNESFLMKAFELEVKGDGKRSCFLFNVTDFAWTEDAASPRFHFSSDSMFAFSETYSIWLRSLPRSQKVQPQVFKTEVMPSSPDHNNDDKSNITAWCRSHSDPQASKWTAAFRRIFLHSLAKTIQIEFVGAPPHYCFEAYEVRLMDESGMELQHSHIVEAKDMKTEIINGKPILFGEFNFTGLQMETDYIPSVIPVERASDGRCLCPIQGESGDPYDSHVVCSCIAADWKKVRLHRIEKPPTPPCIDCIGNNTKLVDPPNKGDNKALMALLIFLMLAFLFVAVVYLLFLFYKKYKRRGKPMTLRFTNTENGHLMSTEPRAPLIFNSSTTVLLIYSHDCPLHEASVNAFAELLRDTFNMQVHLDKWDEAEIEQNLAEYTNASIVRADKIIIVNSMGAYLRVQARHKKMEPIERLNPGPFDSIFGTQIDLALQHARVVSVRFSYTPSQYTLFSLSPLLQYTVPDNLGLLVSTLSECPMKSDPRLVGFDPALAKLHAAVSRMAHFIESDPQWFERSHHRIRAVHLPVAPPLSASLPMNHSIDSGISDSARQGAVVAATTSMESEGEPLLDSPNSTEERVLSVAEVVPEEPSCSSPSLPIGDSAYLSGQLDSILPRSEDSRSEASGSDRPEDPVIHCSHLIEDLSPIVENERVPMTKDAREVREGKDAHYASENGDSGLISDYHSGVLT